MNVMQVMKLTTVAVSMWMNACKTFVVKVPNVSTHTDLMNVTAEMKTSIMIITSRNVGGKSVQPMHVSMANVSTTRMDTVAIVSLATLAPNVNMTLMNVRQTTILVSIHVKTLLVHTSAVVILDTNWILLCVLISMSVRVSSVILADVSILKVPIDVNVTQDTIMIP